jgi:hypothetical protein
VRDSEKEWKRVKKRVSHSFSLFLTISHYFSLCRIVRDSER